MYIAPSLTNKIKTMKLSELEKNVLLVSLDHMEEHLQDISDEFDITDKLYAVKTLRSKLI